MKDVPPCRGGRYTYQKNQEELTEKELPKKEKNQQQKERKNGRNKKKNLP